MMIYKKRRNKYGAIPTVVDGIKFASKKEAKRYKELKLLERLGEIKYLELQPSYNIKINDIKICKAIMDFRYLDHQDNVIVEDVKGKDNRISILKRKLVKAIYDIDVTII